MNYQGFQCKIIVSQSFVTQLLSNHSKAFGDYWVGWGGIVLVRPKVRNRTWAYDLLLSRLHIWSLNSL
jgi:hypothetical protein